jgi:hypothetical protein
VTSERAKRVFGSIRILEALDRLGASLRPTGRSGTPPPRMSVLATPDEKA